MDARITSATAWIVDLGIRVSLFTDGTFRSANGFVVDVDPTAVTFASSDAVTHAADRDGTLRIIGGTASPTRLAAALSVHNTRQRFVGDLDGLLAHSAFGKHLHGVTKDTIVAAYAEAEEVAA